MKKYINMLFLLLVCTSCDSFLDRPPLDAFSPSTYWKTEEDLKSGINNLYTYMKKSWNEDVQSVDAYSGSANAVSSGTIVAENNDGVWTGAYEALFKIHEFMENYRKVSEEDDVKNRYKGEALYFRGLVYFNLLKRFGGVVLADKKLDLQSPELYARRNSRAEVVEFIIRDLKEASLSLPLQSWIDKNRPGEVGRITKGAADALLARVALYEGTHCKFHQHDVSTVYRLLEIAKDAASDVIESGEYTLEKDMLHLFGPRGEGSDEIILAYRYTEKQGTANPRQSVIANGSGFVPTKYLADAFLCDDGLPIEKSPRFMGRNEMDSEFQNRDPRMKQTLWTPFTVHPNIPNIPYIPDLVNNKVGYMFLKGMDESLISSGKASYTDEILFRLTEMYLILAEAIYELKDKITDQELDATINELRMRAGMNVKLTNGFVRNYGLDMRDEIRRERRVELASEGFRYDDLIRWKEAENELTKPVLGSMYYAGYYPEGTVSPDFITADGYIMVQDAGSRSFNPEKNYLFPLPLEELRKNTNLEQNPGWEE
ncbi:RagB/SusD family nutrient uptake outer membrane protein [Bacteroides sp.]|uniref:RagB/SusD family nutrient uptake outer membrane protein n=1 Tax=Bacteroides sp. TaxID=29523 RepID=UPI003A8E4C5F